MNWKEIKEKYPKGYDSAKMWWIDEAGLSQFQDFNPCSGVNVNDRYLYDFFDEQGIFINVVRMWYFEDTIENSLHEFFDWEIIVEREFVSDSEVEEPTRTEAEEQAFIKAFELLEQRLK